MRGRRFQYLVFAGSLLLFLALTAGIAASQTSNTVDREVLHGAADNRDPLVTGSMISLSAVGSSTGLALIGTVIVGLLTWRWRTWQPLALLGATVVAAAVVNHLVKDSIGRPRPPEAQSAVETQGHSFPSAHAMNTTMIIGVTAFLLCRAIADPRARSVVAATAGSLVVLVSLSRIYLGAHWATDVVAGVALGLGSLFVLVWCYDRVARAPEQIGPGSPDERSGRQLVPLGG